VTSQPPAAAGSPADGTAEHWDHIYRSRTNDQLSWTQVEPVMSLRLVEQLPIEREDAIVDVGAGESTLVDALLARGHHHVTALDAAPHALDRARSRLIAAGKTTAAASVTWEVADVLTWRPARRYRLWHDRAVFHFLTDPADRATYRDLAASTVTPGGFLIVATFALDGPTHCSGLPVARYGSAELAAAFAPHFAAQMADDEQHHTPWGAVQHFTWLVLQRGP
jgi:trans-aconitate methyltransferase